MTTVERALNSIGKKCFVEYYEAFRSCTDKEALADRLLANNKNASSKLAQMTRINYARWIFENHHEKEALTIILHSKRLDDVTIDKAKTYYYALK